MAVLYRTRAHTAANSSPSAPGACEFRARANAGAPARNPYSLYDQDLVTFEAGAVAYDHRDAAGFIRLNALRLWTLGQQRS